LILNFKVLSKAIASLLLLFFFFFFIMKVPPKLPPTRKKQSVPKWPLLLLGPALIYNALRWTGTGRPFFDLENILLSVPSTEAVRNWSAFYTNGSHLPGQGLKQAQWTQAKWEEFGISSEILSYNADLPNVTGLQRVALLQGEQVLYEAPLVDGEDNKEMFSFAPAYYGFSANGNITASYVYTNFGYDDDFEALLQANISLVGKIAVVKTANVSPYLRERGINIFRGLQIENCEKRGLAGVLIYPDPQNDGPIADWNGYEPYPNGPARPPSMIERGTLGSIRRLDSSRAWIFDLAFSDSLWFR
jgi:N-acetylated-alpha-linked acidic dipeptidase